MSGEAFSTTVTRQLSRRRVFEALLQKGPISVAFLHELSPEGGHVLGVDLGGTKLTCRDHRHIEQGLGETYRTNQPARRTDHPRPDCQTQVQVLQGIETWKDEPKMLELGWKLESAKN